jgi:tetratricopeptide (TPR) repeat protein
VGLLDGFKIRSAIKMQQNGDVEGAKQAYEELWVAGIYRPIYILPYSVLLLREGTPESYAKAKTILAKVQRSPELDAEGRPQLLMNYAVADWKLGNHEKAIKLLEASHRENVCGLTYQTLGFLYVEQGDLEKALPYNEEALEYDDEDSVCLDNMGQLYYRLLNDKEKAKPYFDKAHEIKPSQIDTLWFLSRYDLEKGDTKAALEKLQTAAEGRFSPLNYVTLEQVEAEIARLQKDA